MSEKKGKTSEEIIQDAIKDAQRRQAVIESCGFKTIGQMLAAPREEQSYLLEGILPTGGLSMLAGKPKAGKSTLARQIGAAVLHGTPCLGRTTQKGAVLLFALEEKESEVMKRFEKLGVLPGDPLHVRVGALGDKRQAIDKLLEMLDAVPGVVLVIIDPIFRFIGIKDACNYTEIYDALERLMEVARTRKVHILTTHHMKKKQVEYSIDSALGSTAMTGAVDTYLALNIDKSKTRTLETTQRYGQDMESTLVLLDEETQQISLGFTREEFAQAAMGETRKRIEANLLAYIGIHGPCEKDSAIAAVKGNTELKKEIFQLLKDRNDLVITGKGVKGDPYLYEVRPVHSEADAA